MRDVTGTYLQREPFDIERLTAKLEEKKQEPTWSINSRESTPEVFYEPHPDSDLDYWKSIALRYGDALRNLDKETDHRKSIRAPLYWKTEADYMRKEFWAAKGRRQRSIKNKNQHGSVTKKQNRLTKGTRNGISKDRQTAQAKSKQNGPVENKNVGLIEKEGQGPISSRLRNRGPTASHPCN